MPVGFFLGTGRHGRQLARAGQATWTRPGRSATAPRAAQAPVNQTPPRLVSASHKQHVMVRALGRLRPATSAGRGPCRFLVGDGRRDDATGRCRPSFR